MGTPHSLRSLRYGTLKMTYFHFLRICSCLRACSYPVCILAVLPLSQCIAIKSSCLSEEANSVGLKRLQALCAEGILQWSRVLAVRVLGRVVKTWILFRAAPTAYFTQCRASM